ncbi:MAG: PAC2 family protein [Candidatus Thorarchaeota archaeon]
MITRKFMDLDTSSLKDPIAIIGLPGIGNVGVVAIETLKDILDAKPMMDFFSEHFPARIFVKGGIARFPKSTIYLYRCAPAEPHDLVFLTADFQPTSAEGVFQYAEFVCKEFDGLGVKRVIALAAFEQEYTNFFSHFPSTPRVYVSTSSEETLEKVLSMDGTAMISDGVVNGANGVIPSWAATMYNMTGTCLLGETPGMIKVDYRASREVLGRISSLVGIELPYDILEDSANKVTEFIEWARKEIESKRSPQDSEQNPSDHYIG